MFYQIKSKHERAFVFVRLESTLIWSTLFEETCFLTCSRLTVITWMVTSSTDFHEGLLKNNLTFPVVELKASCYQFSQLMGGSQIIYFLLEKSVSIIRECNVLSFLCFSIKTLWMGRTQIGLLFIYRLINMILDSWIFSCVRFPPCMSKVVILCCFSSLCRQSYV